MTYQIRRAVPSDAATLHRLILELADYERLLEEARQGSSADRLAEHLHPTAYPPLYGFVAEVSSGEPVGFALCYRHYSTFHTNWGLYLEDLYVRPANRGSGIGLGLMRSVGALAVELECVRLEWQVLTWNEPAIAFYEQLEARAMNDWVTMRLTGSALARLAADSPEGSSAANLLPPHG